MQQRNAGPFISASAVRLGLSTALGASRGAGSHPLEHRRYELRRARCGSQRRAATKVARRLGHNVAVLFKIYNSSPDRRTA